MIKIAKLKNWKEFRDIRLDALRVDPIAFGASHEEESKLSVKDWKNKFGKKERFIFLYYYDKKVVGMTRVSFELSEKIRHIANVYEVYVKPEYRGKGISSELMKFALKFIKSKRKIKKISLYVSTSRLLALKLYKKFGFKIVGELKREVKIRGKYYDAYVMELLL
tara:strand:+ start:32 stop:526 length:495 start_codon:yes stop_codon:yes gene_type:complete